MTSESGTLGSFDARDAGPHGRRLVFVLIFCTFAIFFRTRSFDFVHIDDQLYVFANPFVPQGITMASLRWAMTTTPNGNWHPLTMLVLLLTSSFFGIQPWAFHLLNASLHALNVALIYLFFRKATGRVWPAFFTAILWGLHPLRVESVAWVSELKDVLCGAFWVGCLLAYLHYSQRRNLANWSTVLLLYALAVLSKPMAVTLPATLLLLDFWPLRINSKRTTQLTDSRQSAVTWWMYRVTEKLPLFALSFGDLFLQNNKISFTSAFLPFHVRVENALISYVLYLRDLAVPHHLAILYPLPAMFGQPIAIWSVVLATSVLLLITGVVVFRRKNNPYLLIGWLWYLGTMVPVTGLVQVGEQARADRFSYMPTIGIFAAIVWLISDLAARRVEIQRYAFSAGVLATLILAVLTERQLGYWKDTRTLYDRLIEVQPQNYMAIAMAGDEARLAGRFDQAIELGKQSVKIAPFCYHAHNVLATSYQDSGRLDDAANEFLTASHISPTSPEAFMGLGKVRDQQAGLLAAQKDVAGETDHRERAINNFTLALKADQTSLEARDHLAFQLANLNHTNEAIDLWNQALTINPSYANAHGDLANALLSRGLKDDVPLAIQHFMTAYTQGARVPDWETKLAYLVATSPGATTPQVQTMIPIAKDACDQTKNKNPAALDAYAACLARVERFDDAVAAAKEGVDQALAADDPAVAKGIKKRLALYEKCQPYMIEAEATTAPSTMQAATSQAANP